MEPQEAAEGADEYWDALGSERDSVHLNMSARADRGPRRELSLGADAVPWQRRYEAQNDNFVSDLVELVMTGEGTGGFYWQSNMQCTGMLDSIRALLAAKYGSSNVGEHLALVSSIEERGGPQQWALLWLLCLPFDEGLQRYVCGMDEAGCRAAAGRSSPVEQYVGTDGVCKHASDHTALRNYLRGLMAAMKQYLYRGMTSEDRARMYVALKSWHLYGGRAR
jgi:hypothetical protein